MSNLAIARKPPLRILKKLNASSNACDDTVRKIGDQFSMLDPRCAYMQIHIDPVLWKHQVYKEMQYHLTRLSFGLSSAPKIMPSILGKVVSLNAGISEATDHYINDIIVNLKKTSIENVVNHLARCGLITKEPEECSAARALGLHLFRNDKKELC